MNDTLKPGQIMYRIEWDEQPPHNPHIGVIALVKSSGSWRRYRNQENGDEWNVNGKTYWYHATAEDAVKSAIIGAAASLALAEFPVHEDEIIEELILLLALRETTRQDAHQLGPRRIRCGYFHRCSPIFLRTTTTPPRTS